MELVGLANLDSTSEVLELLRLQGFLLITARVLATGTSTTLVVFLLSLFSHFCYGLTICIIFFPWDRILGWVVTPKSCNAAHNGGSKYGLFDQLM